MIAIDTSSWAAYGEAGHGVALVTLDGDFRHFAAVAGLRLLGLRV